MAGLVESGLKNLNYGDADSVGFFQMRTSIWDKGIYKGYLKKPDLQMQWFTDTAISVRNYYKTNGKGDPAASSKTYGVWIADIERPAAQYRGRYQLRLADAQKLVADTCVDLQGVNVLAPLSSLKIKRRQHPARTGSISVARQLPEGAVPLDGARELPRPRRRGVVKLSSDTVMIAAGSKSKVKVAVPHSVRKRIRNAWRRYHDGPAARERGGDQRRFDRANSTRSRWRDSRGLAHDRLQRPLEHPRIHGDDLQQVREQDRLQLRLGVAQLQAATRAAASSIRDPSRPARSRCG